MLTVVDDERGTLKIEFWEGLAFLHSSFRKPIAAMRHARAIFPQVLAWLKRMGHEHCYVAIDPADSKLHRFERGFGFADMCMFNGFLIMAREC